MHPVKGWEGEMVRAGERERGGGKGRLGSPFIGLNGY